MERVRQPEQPPIKIEVEHTLSDEQWKAISNRATEAFLEGIEKGKRAAGMKQLLNKKEACEFLTCSPQQLELFISKGLKYHRIGQRTYYFDRDEIVTFVKKF
ncbi:MULTISPECIES: helix-turn-helix transcriptional regulator [Enterococcus]|uniref:helix-turn-helix transcriptional regulator n=1 Tax=Enterococcus asini TaxID=57732 RepID=UPI0032E3D75E